jgi:Flp pilus assembly protein TadG
MVTAELAACLPVLVLVLGVVLTAVSAVAARVRLEDAAREAARAAARGDDTAGRRLVQQSAPGARVTLHTGAGQVEAVAVTTVHPLGGWLPGFSVTERAVATLEPRGPAP